MQDNKFRLDVVCLDGETVPLDNLADGSTKYLADAKQLYVLYNGDWYLI